MPAFNLIRRLQDLLNSHFCCDHGDRKYFETILVLFLYVNCATIVERPDSSTARHFVIKQAITDVE